MREQILQITNWLSPDKIINSEYGEVDRMTWLVSERGRIGDGIFKFDELGRIALFRTKENVGVLRQ